MDGSTITRQPAAETEKPEALQDGRFDLVQRAAHYNNAGDSTFEVGRVLLAWGFEGDALLWNVLKYVARSPHKGNPLQDLEKAQFYLTEKIARLKGDGWRGDR